MGPAMLSRTGALLFEGNASCTLVARSRALTTGLSLLTNPFDLGIGSPVKIATDNFYPAGLLPASVFGNRHCVGDPTQAAPAIGERSQDAVLFGVQF